MTRHPLATPYPKPWTDYPDRDGQPMADNTLQFEWIVVLKENLDLLFSDRPDVFVAGDLLWYPVKGNNKVRRAPDALVVFGRPKGYRGSYKQWEEEGIAPQVVFEVLSPGNRLQEMAEKFEFYQTYGVEEYYLYDPETVELSGWLRHAGQLQPIATMNQWISPRLGIRFDLRTEQLVIHTPQGNTFLTFAELDRRRQQAEVRATQAELIARQVSEQLLTAEAQHQQDKQRLLVLEAQAQADRERAEAAEAKLRELEARLQRENESPC